MALVYAYFLAGKVEVGTLRTGAPLIFLDLASRVVRVSSNYHWPGVISLSRVRSYKRKLVLLVTTR